MSSGFVRMLLYMSMMQSSGGVSLALKTFLFMLFGFFCHTICWYFDMGFFLICFSEYCEVIFLALFLSYFTCLAKFFIHVSYRIFLGMGFNICGGGLDIGNIVLAINVFGGTCSCIDR